MYKETFQAFLDEAREADPKRLGLGSLYGIGGLLVPTSSLRDLERSVSDVCKTYGFPKRESFKWCPRDKMWMRENLVGDRRTRFFKRVIKLAESFDAKAIVVIVDETAGYAVPGSTSHEDDALTMLLERMNSYTHNHGTDVISVFHDRVGGGETQQDGLIERFDEICAVGTKYSQLARVCPQVAPTSSKAYRCLQLADVITSSMVAAVAGKTKFSAPVVQQALHVFDGHPGAIAGRGLKLHPDFSLRNLYYGVLGETSLVKGRAVVDLPEIGRPFADIQPVVELH